MKMKHLNSYWEMTKVKLQVIPAQVSPPPDVAAGLKEEKTHKFICF